MYCPKDTGDILCSSRTGIRRGLIYLGEHILAPTWLCRSNFSDQSHPWKINIYFLVSRDQRTQWRTAAYPGTHTWPIMGNHTGKDNHRTTGTKAVNATTIFRLLPFWFQDKGWLDDNRWGWTQNNKCVFRSLRSCVMQRKASALLLYKRTKIETTKETICAV